MNLRIFIYVVLMLSFTDVTSKDVEKTLITQGADNFVFSGNYSETIPREIKVYAAGASRVGAEGHSSYGYNQVELCTRAKSNLDQGKASCIGGLQATNKGRYRYAGISHQGCSCGEVYGDKFVCYYTVKTHCEFVPFRNSSGSSKILGR